MININKFLQHVKVKRGEGLESYAGRYERIDKKFEQTAKKYRDRHYQKLPPPPKLSKAKFCC